MYIMKVFNGSDSAPKEQGTAMRRHCTAGLIIIHRQTSGNA